MLASVSSQGSTFGRTSLFSLKVSGPSSAINVFPELIWIPVFSNNGRWTYSTSRTRDQSEPRPVGYYSCCWYIYPTRKFENKGSHWSIESTNHIWLFLEIRHFSNSRSGWRKIKYAYRSIFTEFRRHSRRRTRTWRSSKTAWRSSRPITARTAAIWYKLLDFNRKMLKSEYSSQFKSSSQARFVPPGYDWFNILIHFVM